MREKEGFTLIEILLAIALLGVLFGIGAPVYSSFEKSNARMFASRALQHSMWRAHVLSRALFHEESWGVRINDGEIILFQGESFANRNVAFDEINNISRAVKFEGINEVVFEKFTGLPSVTGALIVRGENETEDNFYLNSMGILLQEYIITEARIFAVDFINAVFSSNGRELQGVMLSNTGNIPITIARITPTWTSTRLIERITIDGTTVWEHNGPGTPTTRQASGTELDIVDYVLLPSVPEVELRFRFNGNVTGNIFGLMFHMSDGSVKNVEGITP